MFHAPGVSGLNQTAIKTLLYRPMHGRKVAIVFRGVRLLVKPGKSRELYITVMSGSGYDSVSKHGCDTGR